MIDRTRFTFSGLIIIVTPEQAAAQHASCSSVFLSIKEAYPEGEIGMVPTQIDITLPGEGTYFFIPSGDLQEALEAFERGEMIQAGRYVAERMIEERE